MKANIRRTGLIAVSLCFMLFFGMLTPFAGMTPSAMRVLGVFAGAMIMWLTLAISWPSVIVLAALALVPELSMNDILKASMGNSTVTFLIFTFTCTYALSQTHFVRRCAIFFISSKMARKSPFLFLLSYFGSILLLGSIMSPSVLFVIYLPILEAICKELNLSGKDKLANTLILGQLFATAISCGMTPIGHVFSTMAMGILTTATGQEVSYGQYMAFAIPVGLITFVCMMVILRFVMNPDMSMLKNLDYDKLKATVEPMDRREKSIIAIFLLVVAMWVLPDFLKKQMPAVMGFIKSCGTAFPPMVGTGLMCILTVNGKPLLDFKDGMGKGVSWGSVIMAASTLALGSAMTNADIGLTAWLSATVSPLLKGFSPLLLVAIFTVWTLAMTNIGSNMVTITVVNAVAIPICLASGGTVSTPVVAMIVGMLAGYAFAFPPAHPNVALASGSGWATSGQVAVYGVLMMIVSAIVTLTVGYPLGVSIIGF